MKKTLEQRFWEKVLIIPENSCWEWTAYKTKKGYGGFGEHKAHRISWKIHFGNIPNNLHVLHKCDNPGCVRPEHLYLGTNKDNAMDRKMRGKGAKLRSQIGKIKYLSEHFTNKEIAEMYHTHRSIISMIINGKY